ncbi:MAG: GNAT family N-acetyltransferase [Chloroflexota bacterium]
MTQPTSPLAGVRIIPANEATWADIQAVFGVRGNASSCRCQWYKTAPRTWDGQSGALMVEERAWQLRVQTGADNPESPVTSGLVAYVDGEPAGWVAVEPRTAYPRLQRKPLVWKDRRHEDKADDSVWALTCFVVRVGFRRRGLMLELARAAIDFARERGARALEAYPMHVDDGQDVSWGELFVGKDTILAEAGFREVTHPTPRRSVMRVDFA